MRGTEKQIAFAQDIIKRIHEYESELFTMQGFKDLEEYGKKAWKDLFNQTDAAMSNAYAGDIIDTFATSVKKQYGFDAYDMLCCIFGFVKDHNNKLANEIKQSAEWQFAFGGNL